MGADFNMPSGYRPSLTNILWFVRIFAIILIALHLAAPYMPEDATWGIFPYTYWPRGFQWGAALLGLALCVAPVNAALRRGLTGLVDHWPSKTYRRLWYALFSLLLIVPFWMGRIVHTRWGDAYILVNSIPHPEARLTYTWQAPFDLFLHAKAWALTNWLWNWDAMQVYHITSVAAGVIFMFLLLCMADDLGENRTERATIAGLIGALGLMQFYFGYIENYVLVTIGVLLYLWFGLRYTMRGASLTWPAVALALTNGFHPSTIFGLNLSSVWLWGREWAAATAPRWKARLKTTLKVALPMLAVLIAVVLMMELGGHGIDALLGTDAPGGGDRSWLVPLRTLDSKWERYTMFSWGHLRDFVNEQILVAPFSLALAVAALFTGRGRAVLRTPGGLFLAIAAAGYLLFTIVWNPDYGGRRDWDLFAPAALPLTLLAGYLLIGIDREDRSETGISRLGEIVLIVVGVSLIFTLAWVYSNTIPWSWGN